MPPSLARRAARARAAAHRGQEQRAGLLAVQVFQLLEVHPRALTEQVDPLPRNHPAGAGGLGEFGDGLGDQRRGGGCRGRAREHRERIGEQGVAGQRRDRVVRLVALDADHRDPKGLQHLDDQPELLAELVGRLAAARLVLRVLLEPDGGLALVERHRQEVGTLLTEHLDEHRGEAVDGVGRKPARGVELRQREEGPEYVPRPVEKKNLPALLRHHYEATGTKAKNKKAQATDRELLFLVIPIPRSVVLLPCPSS